MLERFKQIAVQVETNEGTHPGSEASSMLFTVKDLEWDPDFGRYERNTAQLSLSPSPDLASRAFGRLSFKVEMAGASAGITTIPPFAAMLRSCGFRMLGETAVASTPFGGTTPKGRVFYVDATASWGTGSQLDHGTSVTDAATGTGVVVGTYVTGVAQRIFIRNTGTAAWASGGTITATGIAIAYTGAPVNCGYAFVPADKPTYYLKGALTGTIAAGDIVTGLTSGAKAQVIETVTIGTDLGLLVDRAPGFGFFSTGETVQRIASNQIASIQAPVQFDIPTLAFSFYNDGNRVRLAGARGTCVLNWKNGEPGMLELSFTGLHDSEAAAASLAVPTPSESTPPIFFGATFTIDGTFHPLISNFSADAGRSIAPRNDVEKANGYGFTSSFARAMTGSLDAEAVQEGIYAFIGKSRQATGIRIDGRYGTVGSGNAFQFFAPQAHFNIDPGERDGQLVYAQSLKLFPKAGVRGDEFALVTL